MALIRLNLNPSPKDLRVFATLWLLFLSVFGAIAFHRGAERTAIIWWSIAVAVAVPGLIAPRLVKFLYLGATYVTYPIGYVMSALILASFYFLVLTPMGLIMRLVRRDPLDRHFDPRQSTYWKPRDPAPPASRYLRQHL